ncbi:MAG TPA: helix-turn-helix domain-containing protein [Propionicimonas sp.]|jgi:excisionase family DNA binding protein
MANMLTKNEAAQILGISRRTLERWVESGRLAVVKLSPGSVRVSPDEIARLTQAPVTEEVAS